VVHLANLGDTRAILISETGFERVSVDHKASDPSEIERIQYIFFPAFSLKGKKDGWVCHEG